MSKYLDYIMQNSLNNKTKKKGFDSESNNSISSQNKYTDYILSKTEIESVQPALSSNMQEKQLSISSINTNNLSKAANRLKSSAALDGLFASTQKDYDKAIKGYEKQIKSLESKKITAVSYGQSDVIKRTTEEIDTAKKQLEQVKYSKWEQEQLKNTEILDTDKEAQKYIKSLYNGNKNLEESLRVTMNPQYKAKSYEKSKKTETEKAKKAVESKGYDTKALLDTYTRQKNAEETAKTVKEAEKFTDDNAIRANARSVYTKGIGGVMGVVNAGAQYAKEKITGEYSPIDTNTEGFALSNYSDAIRSKTGEKIEKSVSEKTDSEFLKGTATFLYDTGMSMADFLSLAPLGSGVMLATMSSSAATDTIKDVKARGGSNDQAIATGVISGVAEAFFEKFSLDQLKAFRKMGGSGAKAMVAQALKSSFVEGFEEVGTEITNIISDYLINGDISNYELLVSSYIKSGLSRDEAEKRAKGEMAKQIGMSFSGGALSGFLMGGGASYLGTVETGNEYKRAGGVGGLIESGLESAPDTQSYNLARKVQDRYASDKYISPSKVGKLVAANEAAIKNETIAKVGLALDNLNVKDKSIRKSFTNIISGEKITSSEIEAIKKDRNISSLMSEITGVNLEEKASSAEIAKAINNATISFDYEANTGAQESTQDVVIPNETNVIDKVQAAPQTSTQSVSATPQDVKVVSEKYTPNVAKTFVGIYDGKIPLNEFSDMFDMLYRAGRAGLTFEKAVEANPLLVETFGRHNAFAALNAGVSSRKEAEELTQKAVDNNVKAAKEGGVYRDNNIKLDKTNKAQFNVLDAVGKKYGVVFVIKENLAHDANGMYHGGTNVIEVSLNAEKDGYLVAAGHELVHYIKNKNEADYKALKSFVVNKLSESYNMESLISQRVAMYKEQGADITRTAALEEIVANSCFDVLSNEKAINELATENKSLLNKIAEWFKDFIGELKGIVSRLSSEEARALRNDIESLEKINELFYKALEGAKENTTTESDGEVKYSQKLGGYNPKIKVATENILEKFGITDVNEKSHVVKKISENLKSLYLSTPEKSKPITNIDTGMDIEIWKGGINETFGKDEYFRNISYQDKLNKIAVMPHLAKLIKYGEVRANEAANKHNPNSKVRYAYLVAPITVDEKDYNVNMDIRKSPYGENRFYIHSLQIKTDVDYRAHSVEQLKDSQSSANTNISQNEYGVNNSISNNSENSVDVLDENVRFSLREKEPPKETLTGYKVFVVKNGKLYPPMVANPNGEDTPIGVWLDADIGERAPDSKTGRMQVKAGGKGTQGGSGSLAFRPGWHLGEIPLAQQFARLNPETGKKDLFPENFVWAECEFAADKNYQNEAMSYGYNKNGKFQHSLAGLPKLPIDGYYQYRTNPNPNTASWFITGSMKVNRILSDSEANKILKSKGIEPVQRQGGNKTLEELDLKNSVKFSLTDSQGNALTQEQAEFFKDSKVRDESGNLLVVYHGTPYGKFYTFNGNDFFFSTQKKFAEDYANTKSFDYGLDAETTIVTAYLNIKKIFDPNNDKSITDLYKALPDKIEYGFNHYTFTKDEIIDRIKGNDVIEPYFNPEEVKKMKVGETFSKNVYGYSNEKFVGIDKNNNVVYTEGRNAEKLLNSLSKNEVNKLLNNKQSPDDYQMVIEYREIITKDHESQYVSEQKYQKLKDEDLELYSRSHFPSKKTMRFYKKTQETKYVSGQDNWTYFELSDVLEIIKSLKYDGIKIQERDVDNYVAFEPNQIKSIDNKNPTENEDIRFSLKHSDVSIDDGKELLRENRELKKAVEILKQEFKLTQGHKVSRSSVEKIAEKYIKGYNSKVDVDELISRLESTFNNISNAEALDWDSVFSPLFDVAKDVVSNSETLNTELYDMYKDLRDELRTTRISLSDNVKNELAYHYGSYNNFRRSNFGKLNFTNDGIPLDDYFGELAEKYTDLFDEDTHELEQPMRLAEVLNSIQPYYENEYGANIDEVSAVLALEMYEDYFAIPEVKTYADKQNEKLVKMQSSYRNRIDDMKRGMRNRYEAKYEQLKKEYEERNKKKISKKDEQLLKQKAKHQEKIAYNRQVFEERNELALYRKKVTKNLNDLSKWLFKSTDKQHVPEKFRTAVASALSLTDTGSVGNNGTIRSFKFVELRAACLDITGDDYLDIDPDLQADIEELRKLAEDKQYLLMNSNELKMLNSILDRIRIAIVNANKLLANENYQTITDLADTMFGEFSGRKTRKALAGGITSTIDNTINFNSIDPVRYFDRIGKESGRSMWRELRNGLNDKIAKTKVIEKYMKGVLKDTDISTWTGEKAVMHTFTLESGEELKLSTAQVMGLYELNKREQARGHIYGSGILQSEAKTGKVIKKISKSYSAMRVTPQDVGNILSVLTDDQRRVADKMTEFMNTTAAEWGNDVSIKMYGYRKFTEQNYYPIRVSENQVNSDTTNEANTLYTLKNVGFTKNTVDKANNALMIDDIFDVFTKHADNMASYSAFVIPLTDITKFYNYKYKDNNGLISSTVKQEMERVLGKSGKEYLYNLLIDLNGAHQRVIGEEGGQRRLSKFKAAAVGANLRVAVQQPMSIARAFDMMNPVDFTHIKPRKGLQETMEKYAPIVTWKNYGFYELDVGKSMKEIFIGKKTFNDYAMWFNAKGDAVTWETIWLAVENEVKRTNKGLEVGSEEFYKTVGERFSDIIDRTQVVDSILHRTQIMRSKHLYLKMTTSFMAEPLKSYNMMYHAIYDVSVNPTKENKARLARTTFVFVLNQFLVSAAASAISALIGDDDDDKTYWERFLKEMFGVDSNNETVLDQIKSTLFSSFAGGLNPLNMIPVAKDLMSLLEGFSIERADMTGYSQIVKTALEIEKYFTDDNYKYDEAYLLENAIRGISTLTGIPVYNITKDLKRMANMSVEIAKSSGVDTSNFEYQLAKLKLEIESTKNKSYYADKILQAQLAGNEEVARQIAEDMSKGGMSQDDISKAMENARGKYLDKNEKIIAYANSRLEGDDSAYIQAADEFKGNVFSQDDIVKSMNRIINKVKKGETVEAEEPFDSSKMFDYTQDSDKQLYSSDYETSDITSAIESGDNISKMVDDIVEAKKKNGDTRTEAQMKSSIRSGVTRHFKEIYLSSSANERVEIERKLYRSGLYGSYSDIQDITKKWREEK